VKNVAGCGCLAFIVCAFFVILGAILGPKALPTETPSPDQTAVSQSDSTDAPRGAAVDAPTPKPKPTAKPTPEPTPESYEHQRQREKQEFVASVDTSVTAAQIAGNPTKYEGQNVELHCTVTNVPQQGSINASCGDDDTNIVVLYDDTNSLDQGQAIRILGTVQEPTQGTNAFGGSMNFPTVKAEFME
jgi:hypothetical protein